MRSTGTVGRRGRTGSGWRTPRPCVAKVGAVRPAPYERCPRRSHSYFGGKGCHRPHHQVV